MCFKLLFALAVAVHGRPQFGNVYQPQFFETFVPVTIDVNAELRSLVREFGQQLQIGEVENTFVNAKVDRGAETIQEANSQRNINTEIEKVSHIKNQHKNLTTKTSQQKNRTQELAHRTPQTSNDQYIKNTNNFNPDMNVNNQNAMKTDVINPNITSKTQVNNIGIATQGGGLNRRNDDKTTALSSKQANKTQENRFNLNNVNNTRDKNRRTVTDTKTVDGKTSSNSSSRPVFANTNNQSGVASTGPEQRAGDEMKGEDDKWIWGYSGTDESTEKVNQTTPDLDDRASFDGGSCPTGKAKVGGICLDKD